MRASDTVTSCLQPFVPASASSTLLPTETGRYRAAIFFAFFGFGQTCCVSAISAVHTQPGLSPTQRHSCRSSSDMQTSRAAFGAFRFHRITHSVFMRRFARAEFLAASVQLTAGWWTTRLGSIFGMRPERPNHRRQRTPRFRSACVSCQWREAAAADRSPPRA